MDIGQLGDLVAPTYKETLVPKCPSCYGVVEQPRGSGWYDYPPACHSRRA